MVPRSVSWKLLVVVHIRGGGVSGVTHLPFHVASSSVATSFQLLVVGANGSDGGLEGGGLPLTLRSRSTEQEE